MNINTKTAIGASLALCLVSGLLTETFDPTLWRLRQHGIGVREIANARGTSLMFRVEANDTFVIMDFEHSADKPSSFEVLDQTKTMVTVEDRDQNGTLDDVTFSVIRDGVDYVYSDPHLDGEFSRMVKSKKGQQPENLLKINGQWVPAKHAGKNAIVVMDGKETLVDPNKWPIAILGPVAPKSASAPEKP